MNEFSGYAHPIRGGWWAMTRFARDAKPKPILGEGGAPIVFSDELGATKAALRHVLAYFNGHLVCSGEIAGGSVKQAKFAAAGEDIQTGQSYRDREEGRHGMKANEKAARVEAPAAIVKTPYYLVAMAERSFCRRLSNRDSPRERDDLIQGRQPDQDVDDPGQNSVLPPEEYGDEVELEKTHEQPIKATDNDQ